MNNNKFLFVDHNYFGLAVYPYSSTININDWITHVETDLITSGQMNSTFSNDYKNNIKAAFNNNIQKINAYYSNIKGQL